MDERKQFTFYESFYSAMRRIRKKQDRADAYDLICEYALFQKEPDLDSVPDAVAIAFELLRPVLDSARKKAASGKQGGSKSKQTGSKSKQTEREKEGEKEKEKEKESEIEKKHTLSHNGFLSFWEMYPAVGKVDIDAARAAWDALNMDEAQIRNVLSTLEKWTKCQRWLSDNGAYIPNADNYLLPSRGYLHTAPPSSAAKKTIWGCGERTAGDMAIIQQMLKEE